MIVRIIMILMLTTTTLWSQGLNELEKRNGFKDIKLTSNIDSYEGLEYKKDIKDDQFPGAKLYVAKKGYYESIGSIKIHSVEVKTYEGSVYEIRVVTDKDTNLYKGLKKLFGEPEFGYRTNMYFWETDNIRLLYGSDSANKLEMIYFSYLMVAQRKADKKEVVEDIVDDF